MGNTVWIDVRGRPGSETHDDMGKVLRLEDELGALATRLGVQKLSDFDDYSSLLEAGESEPSWFDAARGLESVKMLRACLEKNFDALKWKPDESSEHWPNALLDELRWCESVLLDAVKAGQVFRLMIVA